MPLFCFSLLALLFLPLSLSCDGSIGSPEDVRKAYSPVVETELNKTIRNITGLLDNRSCKGVHLKRKLPSCRSDAANAVSTLHKLTCKMKNLGFSQTKKLTSSVLTSIRCLCLKPTRAPNLKTRNDMERKKLCKAMAILSNMTECYQMLNTQFANN